MAIAKVIIPYPDFQLHEVIDPDQFDLNNEAMVNKINEILEVLNAIGSGEGASKVGVIPLQGFTSTNIQAFLNELLTYLNNMYHTKTVLATSTGASSVGTAPIVGVSGENVQAMLQSLKAQINNIALGQIPDGSITKEKLAFTISSTAMEVSIADVSDRYQATNVEDALLEISNRISGIRSDVTKEFRVEVLNADPPAPAVGRMWLRSDL